MNITLEDSANLLYLICTMTLIIIGLCIPQKEVNKAKLTHERRKTMLFTKLFGVQSRNNRNETLV